MSKFRAYKSEGKFKVEKVNHGLYVVVNAYEKRDDYFSKSVSKRAVSSGQNSHINNNENSSSIQDKEPRRK